MKSIKYLLLIGMTLIFPPFSFAEEGEPAPPPPSATAPPSFEEIFRADKLEAFKIEHGLERSDLGAGYILLQAEGELARGRLAEAIALGEKAQNFSPDSPIPHFFLSRAYWTQNKADILNVSSRYFSALKLSVGDFWFLFYMIGSFFLIVFAALIFSFLTFFLYSLLSYGPLWVHQITEGFRGFLHPVSAAFLFFVLLAAPFILGFPIIWFLLFFVFLFWGFYNRQEKGIAIFFSLGIGMAFWILPALSSFITGKSPALLNHMVRNQQADFFWTAPSSESDASDWRALAIQASYETGWGNYARAKALYEEALSKNPTSPLILNNIGNIFFYMKDYSEAIERYRQAGAVSPGLVSAYYNMGQTYREMLAFDEGNQKYLEAKKVDQERVDEYTRKSALYPAFPVIEERFAKADLWREAMKSNPLNQDAGARLWKGWAGTIGLNQSPLISFLGLVLFGLASFVLQPYYTAEFCVACKRAICRRCKESVFGYHVCGKCAARFVSIKKKSDLAVLEEESQKKPKGLYPFFILPGGGHLVENKIWVGFLFLTLFYSLLGYAWFGETLYSSTQRGLESASWLWVPSGLFLLYLISTVDLLRIWSQR